MLIPLSQAFSGNAVSSHHVCHDGQRYRDWHDIRQQVAALATAYQANAAQRWLLASEDALDFLIRLFALLHAGKEIVIPPNFQPGTKAALREAYDADAALIRAAADAPLLQPLDSAHCHLHLYTSGSTGTPKRISKTLAHLEREIAILEQLWGAALQNAAIIATVPHHHIYGLLFRLLWPLASRRIFDCRISQSPDLLEEASLRLGNSVLVSSPAQLSRLPDLLPLHDLSGNISLIFSSGGPLQADTAKHYKSALGAAPIEIFGSTETGGIAWRKQDEDDAWTAFPGMTIDKAEDNALMLLSPILANATPLRLEDAITLLPDQRFRLSGRLDRIVKLEEKRLSLPDLERQLEQHLWVRQCAALVLKRQRQAVAVAIVLNPSCQAEWQEHDKPRIVRELRTFLAQYLEPVLLPRYWRFPAALPFNERGKLAQADLEALFRQEAIHAVAS